MGLAEGGIISDLREQIRELCETPAFQIAGEVLGRPGVRLGGSGFDVDIQFCPSDRSGGGISYPIGSAGVIEITRDCLGEEFTGETIGDIRRICLAIGISWVCQRSSWGEVAVDARLRQQVGIVAIGYLVEMRGFMSSYRTIDDESFVRAIREDGEFGRLYVDPIRMWAGLPVFGDRL